MGILFPIIVIGAVGATLFLREKKAAKGQLGSVNQLYWVGVGDKVTIQGAAFVVQRASQDEVLLARMYMGPQPSVLWLCFTREGELLPPKRCKLLNGSK